MKVDLILPTGSTVGRSGQTANARLVNAYAEPLGKDGKAPFAVYASPGNLRWDSGAFTGTCRGLVQVGNDLIAILGNEIVTFSTAGFGVSSAAIVGSRRLHMSRNRAATPQVTLITESKQAFVLAAGVVTQVTDADLPAPTSTEYLSGYTLYGIEDGRIFASALEDSTSVAAGAFGNSRADDSKLVRIKADSNYAYVFNEKGTEIWQPNANAPNPDFPFSPIQQNISIGCGAAHSVASLPGRGLAWVDNEGIVRMGRDNGAARISSHSVERAVQDLSATQRADIYGFYYSFEGHEIYHLVSELWSWEFDLTYGEWFERETYGRPRCRINAHETFNGKHIVGSDEDGKLYQIDPNTFTDGTSPLVYEVSCGHSHRFPGSLIIDQMFVDVLGGVGLNSGVLADDDPQMMIDYSDDGGATFEGERLAELGALGVRTTQVQETGFGLVTNEGRLWRFRVSAAVLRGITKAALYGRKAA